MSDTINWCQDKTKLATCDKQVFRVNRFGDKAWYLNGKRHRVNGPALEYADGTKEWWYLNGKIYSESAYWKEINK